MAMYLYSYNKGSQSAKALAAALGIKRIKREGSRFRGRLNKIVINWGCSELPDEIRAKCQVLNHPLAVHLATNKLKFFELMDEAGVAKLVPIWTSDKDTAKGWTNGNMVVCRTKLQGHSGDGIVIASTPDEVVDAPLYTLYIPKKDEYRVHIVGGTVVDVARKARRRDHQEPDWQVRSWHNGFVYAREDCNPPASVLEVATTVFDASGLDFGAVDVIYNKRQDRSWVLEINTAPGLEGQTIHSYANAFKETQGG